MNTKREVHATEAGMSQVLDLPQPYLLFLGDTTEKGYAKTAFGLRDWAPERCVGEWAVAGATVTTDLPRMTPKEAPNSLSFEGTFMPEALSAGVSARMLALVY